MVNERPPAMMIRQGFQTFMTQTRGSTKFKPELFDLVNVNVKINDLPFTFHNYRIINLTDIHLGQWISPEYLNGVTDYVNSLNPDMITLTGDYVSYILEGYEDDLLDSFKKLKAKDGKFAVLGNHDHWAGADEIREILKQSDIVDLSNDVYTLEKKGEKLNISGVDSLTVGADDFDKVLEKLPNDGASILLVHEPDFAEISSKTNRFDLQMSGHSHGGQLVIPGVKTTPFRCSYSIKYPVGAYKVKNMIQYTSKGLGTNSFWLRINCKPEITQFYLKTTKRKNIEINGE
ncbi:metallophosphoesterase [Methanobrevibacter millerae]|uniref:metallophosphoesterase n=1 Tax=Methanobrevibacter millerae TaxID=230361 RepID=UPI000A522164|nr:metallophosphoesterase [Methanobrevibacter millerae]MBO6111122.1 metallophosphoesterase [Methanobrevibacter sp.]MBO6275291.1 metallophosphoesterase [Methanobrevibacter sp.]MBP3225911.1 metallophosphoesterase [Methanobrevibacter sp.]